MTAREKFNKGDSVSISEEGRDAGLDSRISNGTVVGFGSDPELVRIRRDGIKQSGLYHMDFWERQMETEE